MRNRFVQQQFGLASEPAIYYKMISIASCSYALDGQYCHLFAVIRYILQKHQKFAIESFKVNGRLMERSVNREGAKENERGRVGVYDPRCTWL